jgi:amidase
VSLKEESRGWDAVETRERIVKRDVTAREVIEAAIERARGAGELRAIVTDMFDSAIDSKATGPLGGVPTFVKDLAQVRGVTTTWGSAAVGSFVSAKTDPTIARLFGTGLVSLGKSATPEFGLTATTEPIGRGPTHNPWDHTRTPGGSSGGAAALVAAGVVPVAHASDGGGSIRIPAACTGTVGYKPTRGRFDMDGSNMLPVNVAVQGVISRTVRDTITFFEAIGETKPSKPAKNLRVAVFSDAPLGTDVHPEHRDAVIKAGTFIEELGHHVEAIDGPFDGQFSTDFVRLWGLLGFFYVRGGKLLTHRRFDAGKLEPWTRGLHSHFTGAVRESFAALGRLRKFGAEKYARVMAKYDVLVCPTLGEPPPMLGHLATDQPFDVAYERLVRFAPFTPIQNVAGAPAISLPLLRTKSGLPIGIQLAAAPNQDGLLFELAKALEEARPWPKIAPGVPPTDR